MSPFISIEFVDFQLYISYIRFIYFLSLTPLSFHRMFINMNYCAF